jgi:hypothetical protein
MSGGFDAIVDIGIDSLGDVSSFFPSDLGSIVTDFGTEFMSSFPALDAFQIPSFDVSSLGGFGQIGSLAGSGSWFDTFNPGAILDKIPGVSDFNVSSLTSSLPSLSGIKGLATAVSDFNVSSLTNSLPSLNSIKGITSTVTGIAGTAQSVTATVSKLAPTVNALSSALGVQNPLSQVTRALSQVNGIAGTAAGIAGTASGAASSLSNLTTNSLVSSGAAALGINPSSATSLTAKATSLFTTDPTSLTARDVATGLPINTPREVDAYGLAILNDQESAQLTRNASLINSFTDPSVPTVNTYPEAITSQKELTPYIASIQNSIIGNNKTITDTKKNIEELQANLQDPDLTRTQQELLETQLDTNYAILAEAEDNNFYNQTILGDAVEQYRFDQAIISQTDASATTGPDALNASLDAAFEAADRAQLQDQELDRITAEFDALGADPYEAARQDAEERNSTNVEVSEAEAAVSPYPLSSAARPVSTTANTVVGSPVANLVAEARKQQTLRNLTQTKAQSTDWRVKLRLAPNSTYLYNDPSDPGILSPLSAKTGTDGVIFPYTPAIETAYKANYDQYDLTHSNYRGYFYKNSYVDAINMRCTFTAQDTSEANYLLAVIHFFRSVTKMFYGQDAQRGSPPPLVFLSGLGDYQFNEHPCVVSQFNYTLPPDVDYVRAYSTLDMSTDLLANRTRTSISGNPLSYGINRILNSGLFPGAIPTTKAPGNLETKQPTYVPTKMEISISLLPIQSRQQVSTQFSLKGFANGNLLKGGFW